MPESFPPTSFLAALQQSDGEMPPDRIGLVTGEARSSQAALPETSIRQPREANEAGPDLFSLESAVPWSIESLKAIYQRSLAFDESRGIDRNSPSGMADRVTEEAAVINRKVPRRAYRFAPYLQVLKSKGARKYPREISIPTARDRLAIQQLKERLHAVLPDVVRRELPNAMVRQALKALNIADPARDVCLRVDIRDFYPSIDHDKLIGMLPADLESPELALLYSAIRNPTVPAGSRRSHVPRVSKGTGVPQGLAISNILADLYLRDVDYKMHSLAASYFRFVDDILIVTAQSEYARVFALLEEELKGLGLQAHPITARTAKGGLFALNERIEFLGYVFSRGKVSVRDSSVDGFLERIAARVARYRRDRSRIIRDVPKMTATEADRVFIEELNEGITGAISGARRYGWMFYFAAMTDEGLLFRMDSAVEGIVRRLPQFTKQRPKALKRLARAYHEVRHRPEGAYIHSYNRFVSVAERLQFLVSRGQVDPDLPLTNEQINAIFERYRRQQVSGLEADLSINS